MANELPTPLNPIGQKSSHDRTPLEREVDELGRQKMAFDRLPGFLQIPLRRLVQAFPHAKHAGQGFPSNEAQQAFSSAPIVQTPARRKA